MRLTLTAAACLAALGSALAAEPPAALHLLRPAAPRAAPAPTMLYYGGPVISAVKVEAVFWTGGVAAATKAAIGPFLGALANSTYTDQLAQYATDVTAVGGKPGTNQKIGRGSLLGTVTIAPKNTAKTLTDFNVRAELVHQIAIGKLPRRDPNTLYMIYFPPGYTITTAGLTSCLDFGAYHGASPGKVGVPNLFYGIEPDCGGGLAAQTVVSSHEYAEALTDAIPTPGSHPAYPQAWNTHDGYEIGDLCEGSDANLAAGTTSYTVQEVFDARTNACAVGNFNSP